MMITSANSSSRSKNEKDVQKVIEMAGESVRLLDQKYSVRGANSIACKKARWSGVEFTVNGAPGFFLLNHVSPIDLAAWSRQSEGASSSDQLFTQFLQFARICLSATS